MKKLFLLACLIFTRIFSQELRSPDTLVLDDRNGALPKLEVSINPLAANNYTFITPYIEVRYRITDKISFRGTYKDLNVYQELKGVKGININNLELKFCYTFYRKLKEKNARLLKHFVTPSTGVKYKSQQFLSAEGGIRRMSVPNQLRFGDYYVYPSTDPYFIPQGQAADMHFNPEEVAFDGDGYLNELNTIDFFNYNMLVLGLSYESSVNYNFSIGDKKVKRNRYWEVYSNFLLGLSYNAKYNERAVEKDLKSDFSNRVNFKRFGGNLGLTYVRRFGTSLCGIKFNLEVSYFPLLLHRQYLVNHIMSTDYQTSYEPFFVDYTSHPYQGDVWNTESNLNRIGLQLSIGYLLDFAKLNDFRFSSFKKNKAELPATK